MTNKIKGLRFGLFCKRKKAVPRVYAFINRRACCGCFHWSINRGYYTRVFLAPIVFVWNDFVRSFCFYLYNLDERIRTFEGCILNVWICIHKEAIQVRIYISVPALEEGWEWGSRRQNENENDRRSCRNRKCRTMEYSLSARLFTLVGFDELVETHLSIFCLLLFFCFY